MPIKKKIIIILSLSSLLAVLFITLKTHSNNSRPKVSPLPFTNGAMYGDLHPGVSSLDDVTKALGTAIGEKPTDGGKILEYRSSNPNFNNELTIQSETLTFVKQQVIRADQINITKINNKYGNYENVLYGPLSTSGFNLYIYPDKGIAYIGNQLSGTVFEIWYFPPTDIRTFQGLYAKDYSENFQPVQ
jgi:hypothetical protein